MSAQKQADACNSIRLTVSAGFVAAFLLDVTTRGAEFLGREGDPAEHFAGIFAASGIVAAFLAGNGVIQYRHHQLGIPFQPDNGELPQGYQQLPLSSGKYQRIFIQFPDTVRELDSSGLTAAGIRFFDLGSKHHGIQHFHYGSGKVGK